MWTLEDGALDKDFTACVIDSCPTPQSLTKDIDWKLEWSVKDEKRMVGNLKTILHPKRNPKNAISKLDKDSYGTHGWTLVLTLGAAIPTGSVWVLGPYKSRT